MIRYRLQCAAGHDFEGWFRNSSAFDDQVARGLLSCPHCGTTAVEKAPMAPAVRTARRRGEERPGGKGSGGKQADPQADAASGPAAAPVSAAIPDVLLSALQRLRADVESRCENVGDRFAEEALRIHNGEAEERGIYGSMTDVEQERLEEEGVSVQRLPWVQRADG